MFEQLAVTNYPLIPAIQSVYLPDDDGGIVVDYCTHSADIYTDGSEIAPFIEIAKISHEGFDVTSDYSDEDQLHVAGLVAHELERTQ